ITRMGGNAELFDLMFAGLNISGAPAAEGYAPVGTVNANGVFQHGSAHLRRSGTFANNLANGNFNAVAASLNTLNAGTGYQSLPASLAGTQVGGRALRNGC